MNQENWDLPEELLTPLKENLLVEPPTGFQVQVMQSVGKIVERRSASRKIWIFLGLVWFWTGAICCLILSIHNYPGRMVYQPLYDYDFSAGLHPVSIFTAILLTCSFLGTIELVLRRRSNRTKAEGFGESL